MGPGPSCVPAAVYQALGRPTIGHLDPRFLGLMEDVQDLLRQVMGTRNRLTLPISGTGSAGMETCFVNLIEPGDPVLILVNGVFGQRMSDVAARLRAEVDTRGIPLGHSGDARGGPRATGPEILPDRGRRPCGDIHRSAQPRGGNRLHREADRCTVSRRHGDQSRRHTGRDGRMGL